MPPSRSMSPASALMAITLVVGAGCGGGPDLIPEESIGEDRNEVWRPGAPINDFTPDGQGSPADACDRLDNDADGIVDEGCYCKQDAWQPCYPMPHAAPEFGGCGWGQQRCVMSTELDVGFWSACEGAVLPEQELCDNGIDEDCDGADIACAEGNDEVAAP